MRLARERIRAAILSRTVTELTDAQVLEALAVSYRAADTPVFSECVRLLLERYQSKAMSSKLDELSIGAAVEPIEPLVLEPTPAKPLTERDQRILERHRSGTSNRSIGRELGTSEASIRRALKRILPSANCLKQVGSKI